MKARPRGGRWLCCVPFRGQATVHGLERPRPWTCGGCFHLSAVLLPRLKREFLSSVKSPKAPLHQGIWSGRRRFQRPLTERRSLLCFFKTARLPTGPRGAGGLREQPEVPERVAAHRGVSVPSVQRSSWAAGHAHTPTPRLPPETPRPVVPSDPYWLHDQRVISTLWPQLLHL